MNLGRDNFREFARKAIKKYGDKGMLVDGMLWGQIVGHYDAERAELRKALRLIAERGGHITVLDGKQTHAAHCPACVARAALDEVGAKP